ncbi:bifunctional phosphoribosylaminoimidazolecarboxamide formyltransferase/IMP cyclohydrolase [Halothermothrix orenii]|uniref:Bifunctional purine biosynthesis protein PurH n=1 Tax=Halothermothrix orenii (strain H 168 / OCM 544 / DSM 9562) TaxID=373903 RepID=B8D0L8_HALOH|nr:bifunctional phosphoribosylaminoimidazolecarboxamide formyltransferase/IMP cyclohydrolase [Halothermothrix orenii]ACL70954.1 IMP cyclohydrolase;phosphoribosylaminoimidazolecarboxamide formyltransferase [Halothermothrix orenii H 168]
MAKRALLSVSDKRGIVKMARGLVDLGYEIISTGGTARKLREGGLEVIDVSQITRFPEMMDGRVKTLHPAIHGGLLALRDNSGHMEQLEEQGIKPIDMVVVNLYPFAETISRPGVTLEEAIENIDIGGPSMIRSAAKNYCSVAVVTDPDDYDKILTELNENDGDLSLKTRQRLAVKAFRMTAEYDTTIFDYLQGRNERDKKETSKAKSSKEEADIVFPEVISLNYIKKQDLRYGENPHQRAVFYRETNLKEPSITTAEKLHGKELSFNNINDANGALELVKEFTDRPAAAVIKHANPCGMAVADTLEEAYRKAHAGDPLSAFGSIVALNREVSPEVAREIAGKDKFVEVVIAPDYMTEALEILKNRWKNVRLLRTGDLFINREKPGYDMKKVTGGLLVQERDLAIINEDDLKIVTEVKPTEGQLRDLLFAWKVVKHVKSNAIVMAKDEMVVGVGAGQMSRVDAMIIAGRKSEGRQEGGVVASDAFFPFPDAIEEAAARGIKAIIQPGGSIRDDQVIEAANDHKIAMVFTGRRHFRH